MYKLKEVRKALEITGPKTVILDSDDVLMDTNRRVLEIYNAENGTSFTVDDLTDWDLTKCEKIDSVKFLSIFDRPGFYAELTPYKEAQEGVEFLVEAGFDVRIATAGHYQAVPDKGRSFERDYPWISPYNFKFMWKKDLNGADFALDDGLHNLTKTKCLHPIVMDKPWNRVHNHPDAKHLKRAHSFTEFVKIIVDITIAESKAQKGDEICFR